MSTRFTEAGGCGNTATASPWPPTPATCAGQDAAPSGGGQRSRAESMHAPTAMVPSAADEVTAYLAEHHQFYPHLATRDGLHAYDGRAPDFSQAAIRHRVAALELWGRRLCAAYPD